MWSAKARITAACEECSQRLGTPSGCLSKTFPGAAASNTLQAIEVRSTAILNAPRLIRETSLDSDCRRIARFFVIFVTRLKLPKPNDSLAERTKQLNHFVKIVVRLNTGVNLDFWNSCALFGSKKACQSSEAGAALFGAEQRLREATTRLVLNCASRLSLRSRPRREIVRRSATALRPTLLRQRGTPSASKSGGLTVTRSRYSRRDLVFTFHSSLITNH